jgi:hypothetical protein
VSLVAMILIEAMLGISSVDNFCTDHLDANGELLPPDMKTMDINLTGCIYTCKLGIHYIRKNGDDGGSVVITASASSKSCSISSLRNARAMVNRKRCRLLPVRALGLRRGQTWRPRSNEESAAESGRYQHQI